jgi:FecR protein
MTMKNIFICLAIVCAMAVPQPTAAGGKSSLPEVPASLPEPGHSELVQMREELGQMKAGLNAQIEKQNAECGSVPADSPQVAPCTAEQGRLQKASDEYAAKKKEFLQRISLAKYAPPAGPVAELRGSGEFYIETRDGKRLEGKSGLKISLDSQVKVVTGKGGRVELEFEDGSRIKMSSGTEFEFSSPADKGGPLTLAEMKRGLVYWVHKASTRRFEVRTPTSAVGVRGTDFEISAEQGKPSYIKLFSGALDITPKSGGKKFSMKAREIVSFSADGSVTGPVPMAPDDKPQD